MLGNIRTVRAFGMEEREVQEYANLTAHVQRLSTELCRTTPAPPPLPPTPPIPNPSICPFAFTVCALPALGIGLFTAGSHLFVNGLVLSVIYFGGRLLEQ
jgi:ATP-binding cassette subfamily B (MDR/TAP) protein 8